MKEPLDLNFSSSIITSIIPCKELEEHGNKLLSIPDLRKQLQYYNKNICSLSYSSNEGLYCFGSYDHWSGLGKIFFGKANPNENPDFEIYLQERQEEINRLKSLIAEQQTYSDKLKCFIEEKAGQRRFEGYELKVENNAYEKFIANGAGIVPEHLWENHTEIDLRPATPDERKSYNQYLYNYVQQLIKAPEKLHWLVEVKYEGFRAISAMAAIRQQVKRALNKDAAIKAELNRIEGKYQFEYLPNYIELLYPYEIKSLALWQSALFNALVNGYEFDFSRKELLVHEMKALIHVEQVFIYYKYVHQLLTEIVFGSFEEMFEDAVQSGVMGEFKSEQSQLIQSCRYSLLFNTWLQVNKGWEHGDGCQYQTYLTKDVFEQFLKAYRAEEQANIFSHHLTSEEAYRAYQNNYQNLRERFRIKRKATKEDCKLLPRLTEGEVFGYEPEYKTSLEAFVLLTNYYAVAYLEHEKYLFVNKYKVWNEETVGAEIQEIEKFIDAANNESLSDASKAFNKWGADKDEYVFLRLKSGFYEHLEVKHYPLISEFGNLEARIYGRYFLFYNFLQEQLIAMQPKQPEIAVNGKSITFEDLPAYLHSIGEVVRPAKIKFNKDGSHKVTAWSFGKSVDELYNEQVEKIETVVSGFKQKCYSKLDDDELRLLALNLKEVIRLYKDENNIFKDNPQWQQKVNEQFGKAANRLEGFLNDVVLPKLELRASKGNNVETENESKPTITAYALMHVYLAMFGGQAVTQQNKDVLVKQYGYRSGAQLRNDFTAFQDEDKRLDLNTTNKRSAKTHLERYKSILPLLEKQNNEAFEAAKKDFEHLNKEYKKHY